MKPIQRSTLLIAIAAFALSACGAGDGAQPSNPATPRAGGTAKAAPPPSEHRAAVVSTRGTVTQIEPVIKQGDTTGAGAVVGGLLGAAVGNQVGGGDGKKAATVVGAVGGAVVGNNVEKNRAREVVGYRITVRLDSGSVQTYQQSQVSGLSVGSRVNVDGGVVRHV